MNQVALTINILAISKRTSKGLLATTFAEKQPYYTVVTIPTSSTGRTEDRQCNLDVPICLRSFAFRAHGFLPQLCRVRLSSFHQIQTELYKLFLFPGEQQFHFRKLYFSSFTSAIAVRQYILRLAPSMQRSVSMLRFEPSGYNGYPPGHHERTQNYEIYSPQSTR